MGETKYLMCVLFTHSKLYKSRATDSLFKPANCVELQNNNVIAHINARYMFQDPTTLSISVNMIEGDVLSQRAHVQNYRVSTFKGADDICT